jgi:O-antigen/teichoic acid export membrane protein
MQENTNRAIAYNSVILYGKMVVNTICALLTTRFALKALGVVDYGLYAVLGGIISFIAIFNTIMLSTSNRFIAVAIGKGDLEEVNKQFNVNFVIHTAIAILALIIAIPMGEWYIPRYVNYNGPLSNALMVYNISIIGSILSFVGVPYNGLLMAKERFIVFSLVDVISHIIKLVVAWMLVSLFDHKLLIYTITMALMTAIPTFVYMLYCNRHYYEMVRLRLVLDRKLYTSVFNFSAWVGVGAVANIAKTQGAALVVNAFFNTVMNTAMGVANSISIYISMFANGFVQPMQPQITKSFAAGNTQRTDELLIMSTKYSFLLTLMIGSLFLIAPEWLLSLWLGEVPPFAPTFLILLVIDDLVQSFNAGIGNIIWASGKISLYQILTSTLNILAIVAGYFVLRGGAAAYYLVVTYICFSVIRFFAIQWALHHILNYENRKLWHYYHVTEEVLDSLDVKYDIADELSGEYYDVVEELN